MSGSLKARLERLEHAAGIKDDGLTVIIRRFIDGPLTGVHVHGELIERIEGESETTSRRRGQPVLVMIEQRSA